MKVAIFGASGLVGRNLATYFDTKNIQWVGTYNKSPFPNGIYLSQIDTQSLKKFLKENVITVCINCVAERNVDFCETQWDKTYETNCAFAARLSSVCFEESIYFLHISTDYVFDGSQPPYMPSSISNPIQAYGKSKSLAEKEIQKTNPNACIVRVPVLYTQHYKNLLETAVTMIGKKVLDTTKSYEEDNYFIRRPVFIEDFVVFLWACIEELKKGIFHFYNPNNSLTKYKMAMLIGNYLKKNTSHILPINNPSGLAGRPYDTELIDLQYDRKLFPNTSIEKGIELCFQKIKHPILNFSKKPSESIFYMIDLDGTLVDTDILHYNCYKKAFEEYGFQFCNYETYESLLSFEQYAKDIVGETYDLVKKLKNKLFYEIEGLTFMPGAEYFLQWLLTTKQNVVVVTNTSRKTVEFIQQKLPILQSIHQWITRDDVHYAKPHEEPYIMAKSLYWKGESYILGIENTVSGFYSLKNVTPIIYIVCQNNSYTYKKLQSYDIYFTSNLLSLQSQ